MNEFIKYRYRITILRSSGSGWVEDYDSVEAQQVIPSLGHYFYVVSWSDNLDLFDSWDTVIGDFPETEVDLIE